MKSQVAVLRTRPHSVVEDYGRVFRSVKYEQTLPRDRDLILKLNLSWTKYFPACSSPPWQLDGILTTLLADGYDRRRIFPVENKTVVTDPVSGARNNKWLPVLQRHGLPFIPLPDVEWTVYRFKTPLLRLNDLFPEGIEIPKMFIGKNVLQAPTCKVHGHSLTTGAIKNAFGGLLKEVRHYAHEFIHEVMVDLALHQHEIDHHLVDELVRVVPHLLQEPAEGVLDGAGGERMTVHLTGRSLEHVLADEHLGNLDPLGKEIVQPQQGRLEAIDGPLDVGQWNEGQPVALEHRQPLVVAGPAHRVRHHRLVLDGEDAPTIVAVGQQRGEDAVELPGRAGAGREVLGPGEIELEDEVPVARQRLLVLHQAHQPSIVLDHAVGTRSEDGDLALHPGRGLLYPTRSTPPGGRRGGRPRSASRAGRPPGAAGRSGTARRGCRPSCTRRADTGSGRCRRARTAAWPAAGACRTSPRSRATSCRARRRSPWRPSPPRSSDRAGPRCTRPGWAGGGPPPRRA